MKKVKQSKKYWALTEAQKRRDWNNRFRHCGGMPRWFTKTFKRNDTFRVNQSLKKIIRGEDYLDVDIQHYKEHPRRIWWIWD